MIKIPQYETMFSLYLTFVALIPCMILRFMEKKSKLLDLFVSLIFIASFLGIHSIQILEFVAFIIFETLLIYAYKAFRNKSTTELVYYIVFVLSMLPLLWVRLCASDPVVSTIIGFTGISYMCFKIWQLLFEIHDGRIEKLNFVDMLLFLLFFPSFTSGPISRYEGFVGDYSNKLSREDYFNNHFRFGLRKILLGVFYKFAMAFYVNEFVISKLPEEVKVYHIIIYAYMYTIYLFFDFAGYSNIAIGFGYLMGVRLPENFNKPFLACNMKEFWARWHMSLSTWFNDYVYGRFVLNNVRNGLFKNTKTSSRWAYLFTMTTMGLWHGFLLHYLIYVVYEGSLLVITDYWVKSKKYREFKKKKYYQAVCIVVCFQFIAFGMLLFSGKYLFDRA